jgi:hypothetical protein
MSGMLTHCKKRRCDVRDAAARPCAPAPIARTELGYNLDAGMGLLAVQRSRQYVMSRHPEAVVKPNEA